MFTYVHQDEDDLQLWHHAFCAVGLPFEAPKDSRPDIEYVECHVSEVENNPDFVVMGAACVEYYRKSNVAMMSYLVNQPKYQGIGLASRFLKMFPPIIDHVCSSAC